MTIKKICAAMAATMLIANGNVKISKDDMRAYGDMAYSQTALSKFGLVGNAKILKGVKDDKPAE